MRLHEPQRTPKAPRPWWPRPRPRRESRGETATARQPLRQRLRFWLLVARYVVAPPPQGHPAPPPLPDGFADTVQIETPPRPLPWRARLRLLFGWGISVRATLQLERPRGGHVHAAISSAVLPP